MIGIARGSLKGGAAFRGLRGVMGFACTEAEGSRRPKHTGEEGRHVLESAPQEEESPYEGRQPRQEAAVLNAYGP